jgi:hypothetical protein
VDTVGTALEWCDVRDQIGNRGAPIGYLWRRSLKKKIGHMVVIAGYTVADTEPFLVIHDPWPVGKGRTRLIPYREYEQSSSVYHWKTYYNLEKTANAVEQSDCRHRDLSPL